jgi:hypothetical protein
VGPLANSSPTSPQATRCPPRAFDLAAFDGRCVTKEACGAASEPPARPLLPVGQCEKGEIAEDVSLYRDLVRR